MRRILIVLILFLSVCDLRGQDYGSSPVDAGYWDRDKNYVSTRTYDMSGTVLSEGIVYYDYLGKQTQTQTKDPVTGFIWIKDILYDYHGRVAIETAPSPKGLTETAKEFRYESSFIKKKDGTLLRKQDYLGKDGNGKLKDLPEVSTEEQTLGWWYSESNSLEPRQDVTSYPYSRTIYDELNPGRVLRVEGGNKVEKDGKLAWINGYSHSMVSGHELYSIYGVGYFPKKRISTRSYQDRDSDYISARTLPPEEGWCRYSYTIQKLNEQSCTGYGELIEGVVIGDFEQPMYTLSKGDIVDLRGEQNGYYIIQSFPNAIECDGGIDSIGDGEPSDTTNPPRPYIVPNYVFAGPLSCEEVEFEVLLNQVVKSVVQDVHGVEVVSFTDSDGRLLASARSGGAEQTHRTVLSVMGAQGWVDFHVPIGTEHLPVQLKYPSNAKLKLWNLRTGEELSNNYASSSSANTLGSQLILPAGFYRLEEAEYYKQEEESGEVIRQHYYHQEALPYAKMVNSNIEGADTNTITVKHTVNYYDYALNYYDKVGRLIKTVQPIGYAKGGVDSNQDGILEYPYASRNRYNALGQLLWSESNDQGRSEFKYRKDGQIRFSQNAQQRLEKTFSYTNYDQMGRPIESGLYKEGSLTFLNSSSIVDNIGRDGLVQNSCSEQVITHYDLPDENLASILTTNQLDPSKFKQRFVEGGVSSTLKKNPSSSQTWMSYDHLGRLEWLVQKLSGLDGLKTIHYQYDANGNVLNVEYQRYGTDRYVHLYEYDQYHRLIAVKTRRKDTDAYQQHATYEYDHQGQMKRIELGEEGNPLQGIDYTYGSGGLKFINNPRSETSLDPGKDGEGTSSVPADIFAMSIDYHNRDYLRSNTNLSVNQNWENIQAGGQQYNGNIAGVRWITKDGNSLGSSSTKSILKTSDLEHTQQSEVTKDADGALTFKKTTADGWDTGIYSKAKIAATEDGYLEWTLNASNNGYASIGLSFEDIGMSPYNVQFPLYIYPYNRAIVLRRANLNNRFPEGTKLRIEKRNKDIYYLAKQPTDASFVELHKQLRSGSMLADLSIYSQNAVVPPISLSNKENGLYANAVVTEYNNVHQDEVNILANGSIQKLAANGWRTGVSSAQKLDGEIQLQFTVDKEDFNEKAFYMVGLSYEDIGPDYNLIDYTWYRYHQSMYIRRNHKSIKRFNLSTLNQKVPNKSSIDFRIRRELVNGDYEIQFLIEDEIVHREQETKDLYLDVSLHTKDVEVGPFILNGKKLGKDDYLRYSGGEVDTSIDPTTQGVIITKNKDADPVVWNTDAFSKKSIAGEGYLHTSFLPNANGQEERFMLGLSRENNGSGYAGIDQALYVVKGKDSKVATIYSYEGGFNKGGLGTVSALNPIDLILHRDQTHIHYIVNGKIQKSSPIATELFVDMSLYTAGLKSSPLYLNGRKLLPSDYEQLEGVNVLADGTIQKTNSQGYNADANSVEKVSGDVELKWEVTEESLQNGQVRIIGLSYEEQNNSYSSVRYGFLQSGKYGYVRLFGRAPNDTKRVTLLKGDWLRIQRKNGQIQFYVDRQAGGSELLYELPEIHDLHSDLSIVSSNTSVGPITLKDGAPSFNQPSLMVDASFWHYQYDVNYPALSLNGKVLKPEDYQDFRNTTVEADGSIKKISGGSGWNADLVSNPQNRFTGDVKLEWTVSDIYTTGTPYHVIGLSSKNEHASYQDVDFGWMKLNSPSQVEIRILGGRKHLANGEYSIPVAVGDRLGIERKNNLILFTINGDVKYEHNVGYGSYEPVEEGSPQTDMYVYQYNKNGWLKEATFGHYNPDNQNFTAKPDYHVYGLTYDANGNIQNLNRTEVSGQKMDELTYRYSQAHPNRLLSISDSVQDNAGKTLRDLQNQEANNYVYNELGQLIENKQDKLKIKYNVFGLVEMILDEEGNEQVRYEYNESGKRISKKVKQKTGGFITTYYVRDQSGTVLAIYDDNNAEKQLALKEVPIYGSSRIGVDYISSTGGQNPLYQLTDHLGNVRAVIGYGESLKYNDTFTEDKGTWKKSVNTVSAEIENGRLKVVTALRLNGANGYYELEAGKPYTFTATIDRSEFDEEGQLEFSLWKSRSRMTAAQIIAESGVYKIHYTPSVGGTYRLNLRLKKSTVAPQTFYVDNVTITSKDAVSLSSKADYYPFGWKLPGRTQQGSQKYRYGYQGEFAEEEDETGWNQFELRMWDGRVGRWMTTDPYGQHFSPYLGMGNNPISRTDPDGGCDDPPCKEYEGGNIEDVIVVVKGKRDYSFSRVMNSLWGDYNFLHDNRLADFSNSYIDEANARYNEARYSMYRDNFLNSQEGQEFKTFTKAVYNMSFYIPMNAVAGGYLGHFARGSSALYFTSATLSRGSGVINAAKTSTGVTKTLTQQADELVKLNGGRNSVTLRTPTKQIRYDLAGKAHGGVPTPHKQIYNKNFFNGQVRSISRVSKTAQPMTQQEIRMIRKYLQGLK